MATIAEALSMALEHRRAGRLADAEQIYRQILERNPNVPSAWHFLGLLAKQSGNHDAAIDWIGRAIALAPEYAEAHSDLGNCFFQQQRIDEAAACYARAIELRPDLAEAHFNLGNVWQSRRELDKAVACFRLAVKYKPLFAAAYYGLGSALFELGDSEEAAAQCRMASFLKPDWEEAHYGLGTSLIRLGKLPEALENLARALTLKPDYAAAHHACGSACHAAGQFQSALAHFRQAMTLQPHLPEPYVGAGAALQFLGQTDEAIDHYRQALTLNTNCAEAHNNLGNALKDQGRIDEAIPCYRRAVEVKPDYISAYSNYLYSLHFAPGWSSGRILAEHRVFNERYVRPYASAIRPHANDRVPDRRLRIGYVSPDFRNHCQSFFTTPLFRAPDLSEVEVFCYSDVASPDETTAHLRSLVPNWREIIGQSDEAAATLIRSDQIDILVDLTMHMERSRPLLFARKPAPVQVAWLAYPGTTGLSTIDYRLTDPHLDPPGDHDAFYSEESIRLPDSFWCYDPLGMAPPVSGLPADGNGYVTFGSLNNFCKVNADVLHLWSRVLRAVGGSRLMLLAPEGSCRHGVLDSSSGMVSRPSALRS